ncbi:hypothetical protein [Cohnella caldifontis]|uniref:hypothetical protein n=1 Tax=Cohnella caldifontis TaxID=3027471 RepID=UPI0023EBFEB0|nr:hypothetical protein [Cohnella sp. YIM B05605]
MRSAMLAAMAVFMLAWTAAFAPATSTAASAAAVDGTEEPPAYEVRKEAPTYRPEALRSGRSFRSPRMGYTGGGTRTGVRNPATGRPATGTTPVTAPRRGGFFGGLFGGFLAGSLLGHLLNPFGYGVAGGVSLIGLLFWIVVIYAAYRLLRRAFNRQP